ncbi:MAG: sulfurtransferase complex subunit TusC [Pseudomonadales bacterium]
MTQKSLLIIIRHGPIGTEHNRDSIDIALACAAFDIPVSLLFLGEGVLQLNSNVDTSALQRKNIAGHLKALPMYDIGKVYALAQDLKRFSIDDLTLSLSPIAIDTSQQAQLIANADCVINL